MLIDALQCRTPARVRADIDGFAAKYVEDWDVWIAAPEDARPELFGRILRRWQATRPRAMRRLRMEAEHDAPFLDHLLEAATEPLSELTNISIETLAKRSHVQTQALEELWDIFLRLPTSGKASCVGISKAVMLLTDGRVGPAFDSRVRRELGVHKPITCTEWLFILEEIADDIAAFEKLHGSLARAAPRRFSRLPHGRLYDMALGPR